jgi:hypothetical protein
VGCIASPYLTTANRKESKKKKTRKESSLKKYVVGICYEFAFRGGRLEKR